MNDFYDSQLKRSRFIILMLALLLIVMLLISLCTGRYHIGFTDIIRFITNQAISDTIRNVLLSLRLPRTLVAALIGTSLALSGAIYQSIFNSRLVSPDVLGVTSGSGAGACFAILVGIPSLFVSITAFAGGSIAVILSILIARLLKNKSNTVLILSGMAVSGIMSSLTGLMKYLADNEMRLAEMTFWLLGDISASTLKSVLIILPVTVIGFVISSLLAWRLNIVSLGYKEAKSLGIDYKATTLVLVCTATLLTAVSVSISGTIGWIGLVIPNIVRLLTGSDNRKLIPCSALTGAIFMVATDMVARSLAPDEIPLGIITGIIGTPLFIFAIYRRRRELS